VESDLRSIGETARASGLSVSALRFYDRAGVIVPAVVDPGNGYRWYDESQVRQARVVAGLRRVGLPLPEIVAVLVGDDAAARRVLDQHLRRLEDGLADARRELSRVHALLDPQESSMTTVTLSRAALAAALDAVRFAVGNDPDLPMLTGVLIDVEPGGVTFVGTDRYRMAIHRSAGEVRGDATQAIAPVGFVDELRNWPGRDEPVTLTVTAAAVEAAGSGWKIKDKPLGYDYPDYRRAVEARSEGGAPRRVVVDVPALRAALAPEKAPRVVRAHEGVDHEISVLALGSSGTVELVGEDEWQAARDAHVAVRREFLLDALDAGGRGQLVLELDGPIHPLAIRPTDDDHTYSILMPVRFSE